MGNTITKPNQPVYDFNVTFKLNNHIVRNLPPTYLVIPQNNDEYKLFSHISLTPNSNPREYLREMCKYLHSFDVDILDKNIIEGGNIIFEKNMR